MKKIKIPEIPFEKIGALSKPQRIVICVCTFLVLVGVFYYLVYSPRSEEITELTDQYSDIQAKLDRAKVQVRTLKALEKKVEKAELELKKVKQRLPDKKEIPKLLEGISDAGKLSDLEFLLFKPEAEVTKDFYAEIPVSITVHGTYHNIAVFFDRISKLDRIVSILDIAISSGAEDNPTLLTASCVAKTYRFIESADTDEVAGKEKDKNDS